jgi:hypothetical protein
MSIKELLKKEEGLQLTESHLNGLINIIFNKNGVEIMILFEG